MQVGKKSKGHVGRRAPRQFLDSQPGRIEVRFRHAKYDWLQMRVVARGPTTTIRYVDEAMEQVGFEVLQGRRQQISCRLSSVFCPFHDLVAWLEAMATGVMKCGFEWDGEGPMGSLSWDSRTLKLEWTQSNPGTGMSETQILDAFADRGQVVRAFYSAFRRFVESPEYRPERYEKLRVGEAIAIRMGREYTEDEVRSLVLEMSADLAEETLQRLAPMGWTTVEGFEPGEPGAWAATIDSLVAQEEGRTPERALRTIRTPYIVGQWDHWSRQRRRAYLAEVFDWTGCGGGHGAALRDLRSDLVERWLGRQSPTEVAAES